MYVTYVASTCSSQLYFAYTRKGSVQNMTPEQNFINGTLSNYMLYMLLNNFEGINNARQKPGMPTQKTSYEFNIVLK